MRHKPKWQWEVDTHSLPRELYDYVGHVTGHKFWGPAKTIKSAQRLAEWMDDRGIPIIVYPTEERRKSRLRASRHHSSGLFLRKIYSLGN